MSHLNEKQNSSKLTILQQLRRVIEIKSLLVREMQERNKNVFKLVIIQMFFGFLCISRVGFNN